MKGPETDTSGPLPLRISGCAHASSRCAEEQPSFLDTYSQVRIWQTECAGDDGFNIGGYSRRNFPTLSSGPDERQPRVAAGATMLSWLPLACAWTDRHLAFELLSVQ
jgi:hypothetical protein